MGRPYERPEQSGAQIDDRRPPEGGFQNPAYSAPSSAARFRSLSMKSSGDFLTTWRSLRVKLRP